MKKMEKRKSLRQYERHTTNPYHSYSKESLYITSFPVRPAGPVADTQSGEIVQDSVYIEKTLAWRDSIPSTKVYQHSAKLLKDLSMPGMKVLFYVVQRLKPGFDKVFVTTEDIMDFCGYKSNKDVYRGIVDLISAGVLARSNYMNEYWINPNVLFSGNKKKLL